MKNVSGIALIILSITCSSAQTIFDNGLNNGFRGGEAPFFEFVGKKLHYPAEARTQGVMGLSVFAFKVNCENQPYDFKFKTKLGFGIEEEVEKVVNATSGSWRSCTDRDSVAWINCKIAFTLNDLYKSKDAFLVLTAHGEFPGVSDDTLISDLEKAIKKDNVEKAMAALTKLVMRFPYNQEYKKQLIEWSKR